MYMCIYVTHINKSKLNVYIIIIIIITITTTSSPQHNQYQFKTKSNQTKPNLKAQKKTEEQKGVKNFNI